MPGAVVAADRPSSASRSAGSLQWRSRRQRSGEGAPPGESRITVLVDGRPKPFPVESANLIHTRHQPGRVHPKSIQRDDGDAVAHELQLFEAVPVGEPEGTFIFQPDVLVPKSRCATRACNSSTLSSLSAASEMRRMRPCVQSQSLLAERQSL